MTQPIHDIDRLASTETSGLIRSHTPKAADSRSQRAFNQLTAKIQRERERLLEAEQRLDACHQRLLKTLQPVHKRIREAQWQLALGIDHWLDSKEPAARLSRRDQNALKRYISMLIDGLLSTGESEDPSLIALCEKYFSNSKPGDQAADMEAAEAMLSTLFGVDAVAGHSAQNVDDLRAHVRDKVDALNQAAFEAETQRQAERRTKRGRPTKSELAEERKQEAAKQASASVRDIYRKLVSSLHPDREPDIGERERKTVLLQRANQAYQRGDLMALFALQMEIAQIDASHLANLPEERIKHYILMLREQLRELQIQLGEREKAFADLFSVPDAFVENHWIDRSINRQVKDAKAVLKTLEQDLRSINTPSQRRAFLNSLADANLGASADSDLDAFMAMLEDFGPPPSTPRKRKRKR